MVAFGAEHWARFGGGSGPIMGRARPVRASASSPSVWLGRRDRDNRVYIGRGRIGPNALSDRYQGSSFQRLQGGSAERQGHGETRSSSPVSLGHEARGV